jgi:ABC-2 type transport system permease protein
VLTLAAIWLSIGPIDNVLAIFLMMSLFNLFAVSLVLALSSVIKTFVAISVAISMIATLLSMLGGLFWPLEFVPDIMVKIAWFTPSYWFNQGLRNVGDITFEGFVMPILFLLAFTVVTLLIGGFKRVQKLEVE